MSRTSSEGDPILLIPLGTLAVVKRTLGDLQGAHDLEERSGGRLSAASAPVAAAAILALPLILGFLFGSAISLRAPADPKKFKAFNLTPALGSAIFGLSALNYLYI